MTFVKGLSGNPAGRRPGSRNKVTEFAEQLMGLNVEKMTEELLNGVRLKNGAALRIYFDRICPKRRGRPIGFVLPPIHSGADVPAALEAICRGLADGELSPEEVESLTRSVEGMTRTLIMYDGA